MSDGNVPIDAVAENASAIVQAALAWRIRKGPDPVLDKDEWRLYTACDAYGTQFRGVRAR